MGLRRRFAIKDDVPASGDVTTQEEKRRTRAPGEFVLLVARKRLTENQRRFRALIAPDSRP
jgi:hypothetical protein